MKRLRLVKMTLIPEFVVDDEESLSPLGMHLRNDDGSPLFLSGEVPAAEWPGYASGRFLDDVRALEDQLNGPKEPPGALT
jgi:hypothetical protein